MAKYKIDPQEFFNFVAKNDKEEILKMAILMVNGATFPDKWITKEKAKSKKSLGNYTEDFLSFWKFYPKKVGKGAAFAVWNDLWEDIGLILLEQCTTAIGWQMDSDQWIKDDGQFIPNPETYLRQRRFEDEPTSKPTTKIAKAY